MENTKAEVRAAAPTSYPTQRSIIHCIQPVHICWGAEWVLLVLFGSRRQCYAVHCCADFMNMGMGCLSDSEWRGLRSKSYGMWGCVVERVVPGSSGPLDWRQLDPYNFSNHSPCDTALHPRGLEYSGNKSVDTQTCSSMKCITRRNVPCRDNIHCYSRHIFYFAVFLWVHQLT